MPNTSSGPRPYNADPKTFGPAVAAAKAYKAGNTCRELQNLIRTRLCFTPPSHWRKDRCVAILVRNDMEQLKWPFPFLELPPELRNMVYRQLLHIPLRQEDRMRASDSWISRDDISCHPKILAASKQIQAEAKGILYGENVRKMYIVCAGFERVELEPWLELGEVYMHYVPRPGAIIRTGGLCDLHFESDKKILDFDNISVSLVLAPDSDSTSMTSCSMNMGYALFALVSRLSMHKSLESIHFDLHQPMTLFDDETLKRIYWPITLLRNAKKKISITGVSPTVEAYLTPDTGHFLTRNTFSLLQCLMRRTKHELPTRKPRTENVACHFSHGYGAFRFRLNAIRATIGAVTFVDKENLQAIEAACDELGSILNTAAARKRDCQACLQKRQRRSKITAG